MAISRINPSDLVGKTLSELHNRPTDPIGAGGDGLTATEVKARHDALGLLVKDKLNEFIDALNNATVNGEPVTPLADLIKINIDTIEKTLTNWIKAKLDKSIDASNGECVYGTLPGDDGVAQEMIPVTDTPTEGAIPKYGTGGVLPVADGSASGDAVNKGQLDAEVTGLTSAIGAKYTKPGSGIPASDLSAAVRSILENATLAISTESYSALVSSLSAASKEDYIVGQQILVGTAGIPDVWVFSVEDSAVSYTYTTDSAFEAALVAGTLQIGYYTLRPLEAKLDLTGYATESFVSDAISGNIDDDLDTTGKSADAKAVRDAIDALIEGLVDGIIKVAEADYAESATYAQQSDLTNQINTNRQIADAENSCPPIVFGTTGGTAEVMSGLMKFTKLLGNTIKWNQLCKDPTFAYTGMWDVNASMTIQNNKITMQGTGNTSTAFSMMSPQGNKFNGVYGHIYLFSAIVTSSVQTTGSQFRVFTGSEWGYTGASTIPAGTSRVAVRWKFNKTSSENCRLYFYSSVAGVSGGLPVGETMEMENLQVFDLTEMFGAGKEPETTNDFFALFPKPVYPYNAGTLLSSKSASLISRKKNQFSDFDEFIRVVPGTEYELSGITAGGYLKEYDANKTLLKTSSEITSTEDITLGKSTVYVKITATTYDKVMFYVLWDTPNEPWEAYSATTVTLPNISLRSKGDIRDDAYQEGGGIRYLGERAYVSGDENDPDVWTDGTNTIYELETPIAITPTENPGWLTGDLENGYLPVHNFGTVEITQDPAQDVPVPQGYFVKYTVGMVDFLDSLGERAGWDAAKVISENYPTTDGTYSQKLVVADGVPNLTWVLDE